MVLRYVYQQGQRQLVPAGNDGSDDRGEYRVFGLEPGDYYVSAVVSQRRFAAMAFGTRGGAGSRFGGADSATEETEFGYALTYCPSVTGLAQATAVNVGLSTESRGVDFSVQFVRTARLSGTLVRRRWHATTRHAGDARAGRGRCVPGSMLGTRTESDRQFELNDVPPGRYTLRAVSRSGRRGPGTLGASQQFANQSLVIDGFDIADLSLVLGSGPIIRGTVDFEATSQAAPEDPSGVRIAVTTVEAMPMMMGRSASARVATDATFELTNVADGLQVVTASNVPQGWMLKAVYVKGPDIIDTPVNFSGATRIDGMRVVLTDQVSKLTGTVHDDRGNQISDFTVIAFPSNEVWWQPQSRYIRASRPDQKWRLSNARSPAGRLSPRRRRIRRAGGVARSPLPHRCSRQRRSVDPRRGRSPLAESDARPLNPER